MANLRGKEPDLKHVWILDSPLDLINLKIPKEVHPKKQIDSPWGETCKCHQNIEKPYLGRVTQNLQDH